MSFTAFGAPQRHGQRAYQMQVYEFDADLAEQLTDDNGQQELGEVISGLGETAIVSRGRGFNEFLVNYDEVYYNYNEATGQVDTTYGESRRYNSRQNYYFKPIFTARDVWSISDKSTLITTAYASFGKGGGEALNSTPAAGCADGTIDLQPTWNAHQLFEFGPNGLNVDENGERKGSNFIRIAHNDHRWYGALSNFTTQFPKSSASARAWMCAITPAATTAPLETCLVPIITTRPTTAGTRMRTSTRRCAKVTSTTTLTMVKSHGAEPTCSWSWTSTTTLLLSM